MARPQTKEALLEAANLNFNKLMSYIDALSEQERHATFVLEDRDRNLRDVLCHLIEWHKMLAGWYQVGVVENGMPDIPAKGYTWKTTPELNQKIWEAYQNTSLDAALQELKKTHTEIVALIPQHSQESLFDRKVYPFTKTTTLGAYFISGTSSHYDWALKKLRKHYKALKRDIID
ncbi:ClbS/DfsB family four-helix bundle protein [Erysipelothrix rhusiopathiae]|uniref:ClbS/DfsB family four-helix bundle protein n=1 Tax=Erysipelothrix sp. strain 2 (EsS2-7-Brazil) TaxID=2500579 RepID=UPI0013785032|nr:ClbS/DfsB family four-helix bundle protein [Erysipelothrix sp. strain 2 (EsS2-7-Brazil)]MBK2403730.1 ClbS/DfsB family four-helix bundle protein [Erysipelothrix sp. strain 2 (EsS2-7-Brazil)]NBA01468.1 ClbS/DfsB family four-helix bundle protein [Erysipelothrix rhusiopathiae]